MKKSIFKSLKSSCLTNSSLQCLYRPLHGPMFILDINTAVFIIHPSTLKQTTLLRDFIANLAHFSIQYAVIYILVELPVSQVNSIATSILALQAGVFLLPMKTHIFYV